MQLIAKFALPLCTKATRRCGGMEAGLQCFAIRESIIVIIT